jgi:hypothetical protein
MININPFRLAGLARRFSKFAVPRPATRTLVGRKSLRVESLEERSLLAIDAMSAWHNVLGSYRLAAIAQQLAPPPAAPAAAAAPTITTTTNASHASTAVLAPIVSTSGTVAPGLSVAVAQPGATRQASAVVASPTGSAPSAPPTNTFTSAPDTGSEQLAAPLASLAALNQIEQATSPLVRIRLAVTDTSGNPITTIESGQSFQLRGFVQDLRPDAGADGGVFEAYTDVTFDPAKAQAGSVQLQSPYTSSQSGDTSVDGVIDEVGALVPSLDPLGTDERLMFIVPMVAQASGLLTFTADPPDQPAHQILLYGSNSAVASSDVDFGTASVQVTSSAALPELSIASPPDTVEGGDGALTAVEFPITLSAASDQTVTVVASTVPGSATADVDYQATTQTLTFNPGSTTPVEPFRVNILGDHVFEANESFFVTLSNPQGATISSTQGTATAVITNDDPAPVFSISPHGAPQVTEGDAGAQTDMVFDVSLVGDTAVPATVQFEAQGLTATSGQDFSPASGTLVFNPGDTSPKQIHVTVLGDAINEPNETFQVVLTNPVAATIAEAGDAATAMIVDDDPLPFVSLSDPQPIREGDTGTTSLVFTVSLVTATGQPTVSGQPNGVSVEYFTLPGTATSGSDASTPGADFVGQLGTLTIPAGQASATISVPIIGDALQETDETFELHLNPDPGSAINGVVAQGVATGTIVDDDPKISIDDVTVHENDGTATLHVSLSQAATAPITVTFATQDGTASAGVDYQAPASNTVTFAAGESAKDISINLINDNVIEPDKAFSVKLTATTHGAIQRDTGAVTLIDDDLPEVTIGNVTVNENAGTATLQVTLSQPAVKPVTVTFATQDGSATAGSDYQTPTTTTVSFAVGDATRPITISLINDTTIEPDETFTVKLAAATGATIAQDTGVVTIVDDDVPQISISDIAVNENDGTATLQVSLSQAAVKPISVSFATQDGTAKAGSDYQTATGTVNFDVGDTTRPITVNIVNDSTSEADETFSVKLSGAANIVKDTGTVTIHDDDGLPTLTLIGPAPVTEGNSGTTPAVFRVRMSRVSSQDVTFHFEAISGTAIEGSDFQRAIGTATITAGNIEAQITVNVIGEGRFAEATETFQGRIRDAQNATIDTPDGTQTVDATILDDDPKATIAGFVYIDSNRDRVRQGGEIGLANVLITLVGVDDTGRPVPTRTTLTGPDGSYSFADVLTARYTITETQPAGILDEAVSPGTGGQLVGATTNQFDVLALAGDQLLNFNFSELGVDPRTISKKNFLGSNF